MSLTYEERPSDSPFVEKVTHGYTISDGTVIRPSEINWHMVITKYHGQIRPVVVGPWTSSGVVSWLEGAEIIWIKFKLGIYMPHLPTKNFLNSETILPEASSHSFWLNGSAWQLPDYENADTFVSKLIRDDVLVHDPVVAAALKNQLPETPSRTVRHRFLHSTGITQSHIRQFERARQAEALLQQGKSILDTVYEAGYYDQPHLTRSLKHFIGYTPAQIIQMNQPICHSVQDTEPTLDYHTSVLA